MSPEPKNSPPSTPPFWKNIIINLLRNISRLSETAAVKLETQQSLKLSDNTSVWQRLQLLLNGITNKISVILPIKLPTPAWIGIIGVIVAIAIGTTSSLFATKPNQVAITTEREISQTANNQESETTSIPQAEIIPTPSVEQTSEAIPTLEIVENPTSEVTSTPSVEEPLQPEPVPTPLETTEPEVIPTPSLEEAETIPTPISEETQKGKINPSQKIVLTPEQSLIAAIENQIAEISDRIASGLIRSIQVNFGTSSLSIIIDNKWYSLPDSEQRDLAAKMLKSSQELDFSHLEVLDSQKILVARSPVVGNEMIIFTPVINTGSIQ